jgi:DNA-binding CsgD family transcriptional regulator
MGGPPRVATSAPAAGTNIATLFRLAASEPDPVPLPLMAAYGSAVPTLAVAHRPGAESSPRDDPPDDDDLQNVYRLAIKNLAISRADAERALELGQGRADRVIQLLLAKHLLTEVPDRPGFYTAASPNVAVARHVSPLFAHISRIADEAERFRHEMTRYHEIQSGELRNLRLLEGIRPIGGLAAINSEISAAADKCWHEALTIQPGGGHNRKTLDNAWPAAKRMLERGVRMRTIYHHSARHSAATRNRVAQLSDYGGLVRTANHLFEWLLVFDDAVAFIPGRDDGQSAVAVFDPSMIEFLTALFDHVWLSATVFDAKTAATETQQVVSENRRAIIRLLAQGETDDAIARRLGISVRTCRAHIAHLYKQFGAQSRYQLGFIIARSGMRDGDEPAEPTAL